MDKKTYIYEYSKEELDDLTEIEEKTLKKASKLNDEILDLKILIDEIDYEWKDFIEFLEIDYDEMISRSERIHAKKVRLRARARRSTH